MTIGSAEIHDLHGLPNELRRRARDFCLAVIAEVYGHGYRPDWHADLDSLAMEGAGDWYDPARRGGFLIAFDTWGAIVGTAGFHALALKPSLAGRLSARYPDQGSVAQVARVYVRADRRGTGIGASLHAAVVERATHQGYATLYLHAAAHAGGTLAFWRRQGYVAFGTVDYATSNGPETAIDFERVRADVGFS